MFKAFCGGLGSGKTLAMVRYIHRRKKKGDFIITNFVSKDADIVLKSISDLVKIVAVLYRKAGADHNGWNHRRILPDQNIVLALDETAIWFNSRGFKSFPVELSDFMKQLRKIGIDPIYAVQAPSTIDINFRKLTELYTVYYKIWWVPNLRYSVGYELDAEKPHISLYSKDDTQKTVGVFDFFFLVFQKKYFSMYNTYEIIRSIESNDNPLDPNMNSNFEIAFSEYIDRVNEEKRAKLQKDHDDMVYFLSFFTFGRWKEMLLKFWMLIKKIVRP